MDALFTVDTPTKPLTQVGLWWAIVQPTPPPREAFSGEPNPLWYEWHWARGRDPDAARRPLSSKIRRAVIARDGYVCRLCGYVCRLCGYVCRLCGDDVAPRDVHIDHVLPFSRGGKDTLSNLQVAHSRCNIRKGARV